MKKANFKKTLNMAFLVVNILPILLIIYILNYRLHDLISSTDATYSGVILL